jgi:hypothetical protein
VLDKPKQLLAAQNCQAAKKNYQQRTRKPQRECRGSVLFGRSEAIEPCGRQSEADHYDQYCQDTRYAAGDVVVVFARNCHRNLLGCFFVPAKTDTTDQGLARPSSGYQHPQIRCCDCELMTHTRIALDQCAGQSAGYCGFVCRANTVSTDMAITGRYYKQIGK